MRKFEKISFEQFKKDISDDKELYESYLLPKRSTKNSAGYDIASLEEYTLKPGEAHIFVTGLKVSMNSDEVLYLYGRSSFGYKYNITLANSVGVIDSDFYNNVAYRFQNFTNEQKEWYKLAIAEQALYMLKNGDLSLDSGYSKDKGSVATRNEINNIQISQETIRYLTRLGLRCTHLGVNDSSSNGNILGYLDI